MRFSIRILACLGVAVLGLGMVPAVHAQQKEEARLLSAAEVLDQLREQRDQRVPDWLLQRAYGVAVVPDALKGALFVGLRRGSGVLTVRDSRGHFTSPVFINLTGGSFGFQFGGQETDIVLVFTTRKGVEGLADGKLTLGAGASVAAGPVGRQAEAAAGVDAEVFSYSRSRGLFAGVALDGTAITIDGKANRSFYGKKDVLPSEIMNGTVSNHSENSRRFLAALAASTGETADKPAAAAAPHAAGPATGSPAGSGSSEVKTFPMEDPAPGKEPPR